VIEWANGDLDRVNHLPEKREALHNHYTQQLLAAA
jgi:hypothetical protein